MRKALTPYLQARVLAIDEVGYLTYRPDAADVLFQVVDRRYLHKEPMLSAANKPLNQWGRVLHGADLAEAITDRGLERERFIQLRGPSCRRRPIKAAEEEAESATADAT